MSTATVAFVEDTAERVLSTFAQVFLATVLAVSGAGSVPWANALFVAAFAAVVTLLTTVVLWGGSDPLRRLRANPYLDLVYRGAMTFLQSLAGLAVAAGGVGLFNFGWTFALKVSLIAAGTAILKGLIGLRNPTTLGAAAIVLRPEAQEAAAEPIP